MDLASRRQSSERVDRVSWWYVTSLTVYVWVVELATRATFICHAFQCLCQNSSWDKDCALVYRHWCRSCNLPINQSVLCVVVRLILKQNTEQLSAMAPAVLTVFDILSLSVIDNCIQVHTRHETHCASGKTRIIRGSNWQTFIARRQKTSESLSCLSTSDHELVCLSVSVYLSVSVCVSVCVLFVFHSCLFLCVIFQSS